MKIAVMGYSGSGKSTLARALGDRYGVEVLHLDTVQFLPGWEIRPDGDKERMVREFLDTREGWVVDGTYSRLSFRRRLEEADLIVLMLFNRFTALWRVTKRYLSNRGRSRPDMAEGCSEKLDAEFVWWVLHKGRSCRDRERWRQIAAQYSEKTVLLKNQRQIDAFLLAKSIDAE